MGGLKGSCIVGQSGGPTSVINASAAGVIGAALKAKEITRVLCMQNGIAGLLDGKLFDCAAEDPKEVALLKSTPGAALGSCRYKLRDYQDDETDYRRILDVFKKYDVRYFFYIGGNDSMDTCNKVSKYMQHVGYECRILGIPKTIDNDLAATDHCPGYGSAAKYIAASTAEVSVDSKVYGKGSVLILEMMGRNAGWLTAAAALAGEIGEGPDLVYLPEAPFNPDRFLERVTAIYREKKSCIVAVSEGIKDERGRFVQDFLGELGRGTDAFGHSQMGGICAGLTELVRSSTGYKTRGIEFSLLQRAAAHCASKTDVEEAYMAGDTAVARAIDGYTDKMVGFKRADSVAYKCEVALLPLDAVANAEKVVPRLWINEAGDGVGKLFIDYALPLIAGESLGNWENGLPRYARLRKRFVD